MAILQLLAGERQSRESARAIQACNDYLRLGPGRALSALLKDYTNEHSVTPPTRSFDTLKMWSMRYSWQKRAESYDAEIDQKKTDRADKIMQSGLAPLVEKAIDCFALDTTVDREKVAAFAHSQWSGWMEYLFSKGESNEDGTFTISDWAVERWQRQMSTPYADLPNDEKESDRNEADKFLALLHGDEGKPGE